MATYLGDRSIAATPFIVRWPRPRVSACYVTSDVDPRGCRGGLTSRQCERLAGDRPFDWRGREECPLQEVCNPGGEVRYASTGVGAFEFSCNYNSDAPRLQQECLELLKGNPRKFCAKDGCEAVFPSESATTWLGWYPGTGYAVGLPFEPTPTPTAGPYCVAECAIFWHCTGNPPSPLPFLPPDPGLSALHGCEQAMRCSV